MARSTGRFFARQQRILVALCLPLLWFGFALPIGQAGSHTPATAQDLHSRLRTLQAQTPLTIRFDTQTGVVEFLAARANGRIPYAQSGSTPNDPVAIAQDFLEQNRALFGIRNVKDELVFLRIEPDKQLGWSHIRFEQVYQGLPVFGKQLVVHLDKQHKPVSVNGQFTPGIDLPVEPLVTAKKATELALENLRTVQLTPAEQLRVQTQVLDQKTRLMIYVDRSGKARLAWSIIIMTEKPLGQWRFFINARRPLVIHAFDSVTDAKRRITYTASNSTRLPGRRLIDEGERSRDPVAQAAHDGAGTVYDYYAANFKRDGIDDQGSPIVSTVHFGRDDEEAENAAWVGELQQMIYGDGGRIFEPLSYGLDVVAHELTHGVTDNTAQLIYEGQSGALNESYSDVFGVLIDDANWTLGEEVVKSPPFPAPVLRDMEDPTLGGLYDPEDPLGSVGQPAHTDQYANLPLSRSADNGGVHVNSGIPNHAAYLIGQAIGREKLAQIYYRALTQYLTPDSDFFAAAEATIQATQELYGQADVQAVQNAFAEVGIDAGGPDTIPPPEENGSDIPDIPPGPDQPPPIPQGCTDVVENGGFESDDAWVEVTAGEIVIIDTELPHSGKRSAWLGGNDQETLQIIYQDVRIPPNATSVEVSYFRLIHEEFAGLGELSNPEALFSVVVANTNGDILATIEELSSTQGDDQWHQAEFDLSKFAGKTIRLGFASETVRGNISSFFVDDVAIAVCTTGNTPNQPQPGADQVFIEGTVTSADTRRGISGAQVFILKPGISARQAAADDTVTDDEVITYGVTDAKGFYRTSEAVPRGETYSVIVLAGGYRPILADDGLEIASDEPNPVVADAEMRRGR